MIGRPQGKRAQRGCEPMRNECESTVNTGAPALRRDVFLPQENAENTKMRMGFPN
jgi:hypothetical protein